MCRTNYCQKKWCILFVYWPLDTNITWNKIFGRYDNNLFAGDLNWCTDELMSLKLVQIHQITCLKLRISLTIQTWLRNLLTLNCKIRILLINVDKYKKTLWPLFIDRVQLFQGLRANVRRQFVFLPFSSQEFLVFNWSNSIGRKAELTLELPSGFEPRTPELGIQRLNHLAIAP